MPGTVQAGQAFSVSISARDLNNNLVTGFNGQVAMSQVSPGPSPCILLTEVEAITTPRVEISNVSTNGVDLSGWRVVFYDSASWPGPKVTFTVPPGTVCPGQGVFEVRGSGASPGSYPVFYTGQSLAWANPSFRKQAVVLLDAAGKVVDFFCAADAYAQLIAVPFSMTADIWTGPPVAAIGNASLTYQRTGHVDNNNAADWTTAANNVGLFNSMLRLPLLGQPVVSALLPGSVTFSDGTWAGLVRANVPATNAVLRADDLAGHAADSAKLTVLSLPALTLQVPHQSFKATPGFVGQGMVTLPQPLSSNLSVALSSTLANHIQVPPAVTLNAGTTSASFGVTNLDDGLIEGPLPVQIVASTAGFQAGTDTITNYDRPVALSLTLPASVYETAGWISTGQIRVAGFVSTNVLVRLASSDPSRLCVPDFVVIPSGQKSAPLGFAVLDNALLDGDTTLTITASVASWTDGQGQVLVRDNESATLRLFMPYQVNEGSGWLTNAGSVRIYGILPTNLTVALTSDAPAKVQVPASVVIPAGQTSNSFSLFVSDTSLAESNQSVIVTASASGFLAWAQAFTVLDDELSRFVLGNLPPSQIAGEPFQVTVTAVNQSGSVLSGFAGTLALRASGYAGPALVSPTTIGPFTNGIWTGWVSVASPNRGLTLSVDDGARHTGSSTAFDVVADRILALPAADLAFDALRNKLLAGVIANASSTSQCIVAIDPGSGALGAAVPLGADPAKLALSDDYTYLYTALAVNSTGGVARVNLNSQSVDLRFALGTANQYGQAINWVEDMKVQPGNPHALVATAKIQYDYNEYIGVYDDGVMRSNTVAPVYYVRTYHITFADSPSRFYVTKPNGLWLNSITPGGATFLQEIQGAQYGADMVFAGDCLYAVTGNVFNTNNFGLVGSFAANGLVIPDLAHGRVYFLVQDSNKASFLAFDRATFRKIADLTLPNVSGQVGSFVNCGGNTFAFRTTGGQIHLLDTSMLYTNVEADLSVSVQASPAQPVLGGNLTYSVTVSNGGPATSFGVSLTNQLPSMSAFVSASSTLGTCTYNNGAVVCALGDLTNGAVALVSIVVQPTAAGLLFGSFAVDALTVDENRSNNSAVDGRNVLLAGGVAPVSPVSLLTSDIVFDPATQLIFATVPASSTGLSNCLVSLDPLTGRVGAPLFVGRQPSRLAIAPGGRDLYIGLDEDYAVRRYDTVSQTLYPPFSLGANTVAYAMAVRPGTPQVVAVSRWVPSAASFAKVALYDNGMPQPATVHSPYIEFSSDGTMLYGGGANSGSDAFFINQVIATGLTNLSTAELAVNSNLEMDMGNGLAYYAPGMVFNPATGTLTSQVFKNIGYAPVQCVDEASNRVFFIHSDSKNWFLQQFNLTSHALEASQVLPALLADPRDLIRWGTNGLAFRNGAGELFLAQIPALPKVPSLGVAQSVSPTVGTVGSPLDYTILVTNRGPVEAANVVLTDILPAGALYVSASSSQGTVTQAQGAVVFSLGSLSNGASATLHVVAAPGQAGWNVNTNYLTATLYELSSGANSSVISNWVNLSSGGGSIASQFFVSGLSSLVYDRLNQVLYAGGNGNGGMFSNCIVGIDPRTGSLQSQLGLGDVPGRLALSDDSHYLYVGLSSTGGVARLNLWSNRVDLRFALGENDRFGFYGAGDLKVVPGQPEALAVSINHGQGNEGVQIYDNGVARSNASPGSIYGGTYWISFGSNSSVLYSTFPYAFRTISVDATGATLLSESGNLVPGYDTYFEYDAGKVYFQSGRIVDPVAQTIVGQLPVSGLVAPDSASGRVYFLTSTGYQPMNYQMTLRAFDPGTSNELWSVALPVNSGSAAQLLNCGTNGLAVLTDSGNLFLVRPAALATPAADLSISQTLPAVATASTPLSFVYTVQNLGLWTASGVVLSNPLPAGATFVSATTTKGSCVFTNGTVVGSLGSVAKGAVATITVKYTVPTGGTIANLATVWHSTVDPNPANDSTLASLSVASQPSVSIVDTNVVQGMGKTMIVFNLSLSGPSSVPVSANYQTADGTALAGVDYDSASGVVTFSPGATNMALYLNIIRPTISSLPSTFFYVNLFSPTNASLLRTQAVGSIITRNYRTVSASNASVVEGNGGVDTVQFKLSLNATSAVPVSVQYQTVNGTAVSGSDYQPVAGTVVIPAGTTNLTLLIPVFGDLCWEPDESFSLLLFQPQNAFLATDECAGTILNDDPLPSLTARIDSGSLVLNWAGGPYTLQSSTNAMGPFVDIPGAASPYTNSIGVEVKSFFRLRTQ